MLPLLLSGEWAGCQRNYTVSMFHSGRMLTYAHHSPTNFETVLPSEFNLGNMLRRKVRVAPRKPAQLFPQKLQLLRFVTLRPSIYKPTGSRNSRRTNVSTDDLIGAVPVLLFIVPMTSSNADESSNPTLRCLKTSWEGFFKQQLNFEYHWREWSF